MRRRLILIGLALVVVVIGGVVALNSRGEDPRGETEEGIRGFPLRGSLAEDDAEIEAAVAAWREEIAEDEKEAEEDDDDGEDTSARDARRPDEDDDIAVLWIGHVDEREDAAVLESRGLVAQLKRRRDGGDWFLRGERPRPDDDFRGTVPIGVSDAILTPSNGTWRYVNASFSDGYEAVGDGLFWDDGSADGFLLPQRADDDRVPIYVTETGGRYLEPEAFDAFIAALDQGYGRAIWLATTEAVHQTEDLPDAQRTDDVPTLTLTWTGRAPGYAHAAAVLDRDGYSGRRSVGLGYGETPTAESRSEDKDEGTVELGTAGGRNRTADRSTFAAAAYAAFDDIPYLVLAGGGETDTLHALVGPQELTRKAGVTFIDGRRFVADVAPDTVVFGRTAKGEVVAPLQPPGSP